MNEPKNLSMDEIDRELPNLDEDLATSPAEELPVDHYAASDLVSEEQERKNDEKLDAEREKRFGRTGRTDTSTPSGVRP